MSVTEAEYQAVISRHPSLVLLSRADVVKKIQLAKDLADTPFLKELLNGNQAKI